MIMAEPQWQSWELVLGFLILQPLPKLYGHFLSPTSILRACDGERDKKDLALESKIMALTSSELSGSCWHWCGSDGAGIESGLPILLNALLSDERKWSIDEEWHSGV